MKWRNEDRVDHDDPLILSILLTHNSFSSLHSERHNKSARMLRRAIGTLGRTFSINQHKLLVLPSSSAFSTVVPPPSASKRSSVEGTSATVVEAAALKVTVTSSTKTVKIDACGDEVRGMMMIAYRTIILAVITIHCMCSPRLGLASM